MWRSRGGLCGGFWAGVALGCGAVTVDVTYTVLYAIGVARLTDNPAVYWTLAAAGVAMLAFLGVMSLRGAARRWRGGGRLLEKSAAPSLHGGYLTGLLMTATNPMTIAFWFTVLPALAGTITTQPRRDLPIICVGVFLGAIGWVLSFSAAAGLCRPIPQAMVDDCGRRVRRRDVAGFGVCRAFACRARTP